MKEPCSIKNTLLIARQEAADAYARAVADLARRIGSASDREYELLSRVAEMTRKRFQEAHTDLQNHIAQHGCDDTK
jgi:hypothetical protein